MGKRGPIPGPVDQLHLLLTRCEHHGVLTDDAAGAHHGETNGTRHARTDLPLSIVYREIRQALATSDCGALCKFTTKSRCSASTPVAC